MARWLMLIAITQQISCSGGAGGSGAKVDLLPSVTLSISPSSAQVPAGASVQFTVIIQNASNPAVTWQVNGTPGGNSSAGTIAPVGLAAASYSAPASVSNTLTVTVTAVLQADATKFASASVTVNPPPGPQISIFPANATVVQGTSLQFSATVQNGPQAVIWEVNDIAGGSGSNGIGTISTSGFYAAPSRIPNPAAVTITAVLFSNSAISASTTLTIVPPIPTISVSPSTANVIAGQSLQFSATVRNSSAPVTWQVTGPTGTNPGTISPAGVYMAPVTIPPTPNPFTVTITATLQATPSVSASAGITIVAPGSFTGVYSWRNDNGLTGQNAQETMLNPSSLMGATGKTFGKLFGCRVDGAIFAEPLYAANVAIPSQGTHNVVYVATENDSVYAFDAQSSACQILWQVSFANPNLGTTAVPAADIPGQTDILPVIGITGTPVIDPNTATLYVVSKTKMNHGAIASYSQQLHSLDLTTGWVGGVVGAEKFGGPVDIQANVNGNGDGSNSGIISFQSLTLTENQRSALQLANGNIYVAFDSYSDSAPFHGWIFAYNAANLQGAPAVFISTPNGFRGGIGESGAPPSTDASGNVFVITSDGQAAIPSTGTDYPDTLLKLLANSPPTSFTVVDTFTRANEVSLAFQHKYFGSTGVLFAPGSAGTATHPHLAVAGDEAGNLYLLDRDNLATNGSLQTLSVAGPFFGTPAYWAGNNTVYVAAAGDNLRAFTLLSGVLSSSSCPPPSLCSTDTFPLFGASPVISWDGNNSSSGIVWALDTSGYLASPPQPAILRAYDPSNVAIELYISPSAGNSAAGGAVKFAVPTIANGRVYIGTQLVSQTGTQGELSVFGLH